jgi:hypothetical protein
MSVRFVKAPIGIAFDFKDSNIEEYTREYDQLS